jgi:hypothetical protein
MAFAAALRAYNLSLVGYWTDELCTLSEADGHGLELDAAGTDRVLPPQPCATRLADARPAWAIPRALAEQDTHPPLYFLLVRVWEDCFGDTEAAVRSLDVCFSVAAVGLLFYAARPDVGTGAALWAALVMAVASPQVQFAQEARNYMPVVSLSLGAVIAGRRLRDRPGIGPGAALAACVLGMMLTHYYAALVVAALAGHAVITLRGRALARAAAAFAGAAVAFGVLWGPGLVRQIPTFRNGDMAWLTDAARGHVGRALVAIAKLPVRWVADVNTPVVVAGGALFLLLPWAWLARPPLRLWVLWVAIPTLAVAAGDLLHATTQATLLRYTLFATPAAYVLIAAAVPAGRFRAAPPALAVVAGLLALRSAYVPPWKIDLRTPTEFVAHHPAAGLVVSGPDPVLTQMSMAAFAHYLPAMPPAAVILTRPADAATLAKLSACPRVWVVWMWPSRPIGAFLPGYEVEDEGAIPHFGNVAVGQLSGATTRPN